MTPSLDIIVPVLMSVALLWWFGRALSLRAMIVTTVVTLVAAAAIVFAENAGWFR